MPRKGANISLSSYDDIFETDESRAESQLEKVQKIPISELVPLKTIHSRWSMTKQCYERLKVSHSLAS